MIIGFFNLPWFLWAVLSLGVAVLYTFIWPRKAAGTAEGFRFFIIRWGHALVWGLLAVNFALRGISPSVNGAANLTAFAAGIVYLLFMIISFVIKN